MQWGDKKMIETITQAPVLRKERISRNCVVYRMMGAPGEGKETVYTILPGVTVIYKDFHTAGYTSDLQYTEKMISIDHCAEGCLEWEHGDGSFCYLWEGDVQISTNADHLNRYGFPTHHYHGVTVNFLIEQAKESLKTFFPLIDIDLDALWQCYSVKKDFFIMRSEKTVQSIFTDLDENRDNIPNGYLQIKTLELLIALSQIKTVETTVDKPYFRRSQVEKVRAVKAYLCDNPNKKVTLRELSAKFAIPLSTLRSCFKAMYGQSIYAFTKQFRLQKAAQLLRTTELSVMDIALETGYENPSKFTAAFKEKFAVTPLKCRKDFNKTEHF